MIKRPRLGYVTPDTDTPFYHLSFFKLKKNQRRALTDDTPTHVSKQLNQIARFK